jgi:hypothetical protein
MSAEKQACFDCGKKFEPSEFWGTSLGVFRESRRGYAAPAPWAGSNAPDATRPRGWWT